MLSSVTLAATEALNSTFTIYGRCRCRRTRDCSSNGCLVKHLHRTDSFCVCTCISTEAEWVSVCVGSGVGEGSVQCVCVWMHVQMFTCFSRNAFLVSATNYTSYSSEHRLYYVQILGTVLSGGGQIDLNCNNNNNNNKKTLTLMLHEYSNITKTFFIFFYILNRAAWFWINWESQYFFLSQIEITILPRFWTKQNNVRQNINRRSLFKILRNKTRCQTLLLL